MASSVLPTVPRLGNHFRTTCKATATFAKIPVKDSRNAEVQIFQSRGNLQGPLQCLSIGVDFGDGCHVLADLVQQGAALQFTSKHVKLHKSDSIASAGAC